MLNKVLLRHATSRHATLANRLLTKKGGGGIYGELNGI